MKLHMQDKKRLLFFLKKGMFWVKESLEIKNRIMVMKNSVEELADKLEGIFQKWSKNGK